MASLAKIGKAKAKKAMFKALVTYCIKVRKYAEVIKIKLSFYKLAIATNMAYHNYKLRYHIEPVLMDLSYYIPINLFMAI